MRLVEQWVKQFKLSFDEKGSLFEITVKSGIKSSLNKSVVIKDFDIAQINEFKIGGQQEQIDLLIRIGKVVLVGEIKSKITTDSYASHRAFLDTMEGGVNQVSRKCTFVENNLSQVFNKLTWGFQNDEKYIVHPVIITNNFAGIGTSFSNVPIIDSKILEYYFCNTSLRLFSIQENNKLTDVVWLSLYKNQGEAEKNIIKYLKCPPQLHNPTVNFIENIYQYPCLTANEFIVTYNTIISQSINIDLNNTMALMQLMENKYEFPLVVNLEFLKK